MDLEEIKKDHLEAVRNLADSLMTNRHEQIRRFVNLDCKELIAEVERLRAAIDLVQEYAGRTHGYWDSGDDHKVGKRLLALAGVLKGYDLELDKAFNR